MTVMIVWTKVIEVWFWLRDCFKKKVVITAYNNIWAHRELSHMHILGTTGKGKSRFMEWMMRKDLTFEFPSAFCFVDFHGDSYYRMVNYLAKIGRTEKVILLDLSNPTHIVGLDFLPKLTDLNQSKTEAVNAVSLIAKMTGAAEPQDMPTFRRVCGLIAAFCIETGRTLNQAAYLLNHINGPLRVRATTSFMDTGKRLQWQDFISVTLQRDWNALVLSTQNRIADIVNSPLPRYLCTKPAIDFTKILDDGYIVLVNLKGSDDLKPTHAKMFATYLMHSFFQAAMKRKGDKKYTLYLDEVQNYLTPDIAMMLDQALKRKLHVVLSHHHMEQDGFRDPAIRESVMSNARLRVMFGGCNGSQSLPA